LLQKSRAFWKGATLLCVTHDVAETHAFDRVLMMADGAIVEEGSPGVLAENEQSVYRRMLDAEADVSALWSSPKWRALSLQEGTLADR